MSKLLQESSFTEDKKNIHDTLNSMCVALNNNNIKVASKYLLDNALLVRPTGNPLTKKDWINMLNSKDVNIKKSELMDINKIDINRDWAFVCYTLHEIFSYKGNENDDVSVCTALLKKVPNVRLGAPGVWKISNLQRSTGRSPNEPLPKFI